MSTIKISLLMRLLIVVTTTFLLIGPFVTTLFFATFLQTQSLLHVTCVGVFFTLQFFATSLLLSIVLLEIMKWTCTAGTEFLSLGERYVTMSMVQKCCLVPCCRNLHVRVSCKGDHANMNCPIVSKWGTWVSEEWGPES